MSKIFVAGDIHGTLDIDKLDRFAKTDDFSKEDYMILLGDVGVYWYGDYRDIVTNKRLHEYPWTILWVDGNHENYELIKKQKIKNMFGGKVSVHAKYEDVIHLRRGQVYEIADTKIFTFGGAYSIDAHRRINHVSWFEEEMPNVKEYEEGLKNLENNNNKVDFILTHTGPEFICRQLEPEMFPGEEAIQRYFEQISNDVQFKDWYFGHWHRDVDIDKYHVRYDKIDRIV